MRWGDAAETTLVRRLMSIPEPPRPAGSLRVCWPTCCISATAVLGTKRGRRPAPAPRTASVTPACEDAMPAFGESCRASARPHQRGPAD
jgi:hypothetical protein